jgi:hypothetical protein
VFLGSNVELLPDTAAPPIFNNYQKLADDIEFGSTTPCGPASTTTSRR